MQAGDRFEILSDAKDAGWLVSKDAKGKEGLVPITHVTQDPIVGRRATAKYPYNAVSDDELTFKVRNTQISIA